MTRILGFNEPERGDQANHSVGDALWSWKQISDRVQGSGLKLDSPAVSDTWEGQQWITQFMDTVDRRNRDNDPTNNMQVDEIAFHWYGNVNPNDVWRSANAFLGRVERYRNRFGRPVWVTEFAGMDCGNQRTTAEQAEAKRKFLDIVIPRLENRNYVKGYMWWQWGKGESLETQVMEWDWHRHVPSLIGDAGNGGTLWIHGSGTDATGNGLVPVDANTTLRLGNEVDNWGFTLPWDMWWRGGNIDINGVGVALTGDVQIVNSTLIDVQAGKDMTLAGSVCQTLGAAAGTLVKTGDGLLVLRGDSTYGGATRVNGGTLLFDGATGASAIVVATEATLAGQGGTGCGDQRRLHAVRFRPFCRRPRPRRRPIDRRRRA